MKNEQNLQDTIEINVAQVHKAVGSLFDDTQTDIKLPPEDEENENQDDAYYDKFKGSNNPYLKKRPSVTSVAEQNHYEEELEDNNKWEGNTPWVEDQWTEAGGHIRRRDNPGPRPAVKVNASIPAASRNPEPPSPKSRPKSRYLFLEEDDEFATFRQRYSRDRTKKRESGEEQDQLAPAIVRTAEPVRPITPPSNRLQQEEQEPPRRPKRKRPPAEDIGFYQEEAYVSSGMPAPLRWMIVAIMVLMLAMMAFLIYRNSIVGRELEEANYRLVSLPVIQGDLTLIQLELYSAEETIAGLEAENARLAAIVEGMPTNITEDDIEYGQQDDTYPYGTVNGAETTQQPLAATPPAAPTSRTHTVVTGDTLYRISVQFFGNGSQANIERIMSANNITDPDTIQVGMQLNIPN